jgi:hypothetical protein
VRETILKEIKRLADAGGGIAPGSRAFENATGIRESTWRGKFWARWSDAVTEAGLEPNAKREKFEESFILEKLAEACVHFKKFPTAMELRMYSKVDSTFPNLRSIARHVGSFTNAPRHLADWAKANNRIDIEDLIGSRVSGSEPIVPSSTEEGLVYLIKSGAYYKIGRSDELERRVKEIRIALPETASLIHTIRTDDPSGIEAYWHRRFDNRRANGEWFRLTMADIAAFKKRRYQ